MELISITNTQYQKTYWERLKEHSGIEYGVGLPIAGFFAGAMNKSVKDDDLLGQLILGLGGFLVLGVICWTGILISNFRKN